MIPFRAQGYASPSSAVATVVRTSVVPHGKIFCVESILAMDLTSDISTSIEVGASSGSNLVPVDVTAGVFSAGTSHTIKFPIRLIAGESVYAKFSTPTANDSLVVVAHGYLEDA